MKVLIIEDETELQGVIQHSLAEEGYLMETAGNFDQALDKIISYEYDCILLHYAAGRQWSGIAF
ncbi:hypothetical protein A8C56_07710 [Niabella ginsenosidivorans]|uniref:Response regulatory domain-containing protein n=1 Tax=Niabella ginsenosidivorans TaxID=1176587 RepID=A0A1A9I1E2_9BACT|nr:response regulator [Niabella ginsenosidivorans]ANH80879.1 hypothetical protein A8C56_07710 [Niabella ginsenosidivorans]